MPEPLEAAPLVQDDDAPEPEEQAAGGGTAAETDVEDPAFETFLQFLKESRSYDFTGYKRPSLIRRVRHRMQAVGLGSYEAYQDMLQMQPAEFTALFNTILINVTSFFRDLDAWDYLRTDILPDLLRAVDGAPVRVWSAGASAGQEAYSIAMLLHQLMGTRFRDQVKIYATDVDEDALNHARQASYTERQITGMPQAYRDRYLDRVGDRYLVSPDVRRGVIFGRNDLTRDAPISRIDVLLCRNTLMYLNAETQDRVVDRFGFALRPEGVLLLGKAEMLINRSDLFEPVDLGRRLFRRVITGTENAAGAAGQRRAADRAVIADDAERLRSEILLTNPVAQIAVSAAGRLILVNHRASGMLGISDRDLGRPFQDLEVSYRPLELRSHLVKVTETSTPVWLREVEWRRSGPDPVFVDVHVVPLLDGSGSVGGASISFTDVTRFRQLRIEVELANRQLEAAYQGLQSTNEELETMNGELQSANDERQSTSGQLRHRTQEISELNAFMAAILGSMQGAVIVVDRDLVVRVWTPRACDLWGLRADEAIGHHLLNLDSGLPTSELHPWLRAVVSGQQPAVVDQHLRAVNRRGRPVELRITVTPLQSDEQAPSGALVSMETAVEPNDPAISACRTGFGSVVAGTKKARPPGDPEIPAAQVGRLIAQPFDR